MAFRLGLCVLSLRSDWWLFPRCIMHGFFAQLEWRWYCAAKQTMLAADGHGVPAMLRVSEALLARDFIFGSFRCPNRRQRLYAIVFSYFTIVL